MKSKQFNTWVWLVLVFVLFTACADGKQAEQVLPTVTAVAVLEDSYSATDVGAESSLVTSEPVTSDDAETGTIVLPTDEPATDPVVAATEEMASSSTETGAEPPPESDPTVAPTALPTNEPPPAVSPVVTSRDTPYRIAYVAFGIEAQRSQIRMMEPDGSNIRLLLDGLHIDTRILDWSSDGEWLLLSSVDEGTFGLRMNGSQQTVAIGTEYHSFGAISPTSTQAVVGFWEHLQLIDVATGEKTEIPLPLHLRESEEFPLLVGQFGNVAWSPDGSWFVFQLVGKNEANEVTEALYRYTVANGASDPLYTDTQFLEIVFQTTSCFDITI